MVKKRKGASKPSAASKEVVRASPELPSIQDDASEVFLDPCDVLEPEKEFVAEEIKSTPKPTWADDTAEMDYQASAQFTWSKFNLNQVKSPSSQLSFTEPIKIGDQVVANIDLDEVAVEASFWKSSIICIVLGTNPPFRVFEGFIKRIWGNLGVERIVRMHSGFTLVSFKDEATRNVILETGVIQFDRKPVILRPWTEDMDTARMVKSVPVWVRLNGLGLQYWGKKSLSALVSTIGKPIMADKVTLERSMIKYARVLVDVEIKEELPRTIAFVNEKKQLIEQPIEFEWLPTKCTACDMLGHSIANCNKGKPAMWKKNKQGDTRPAVENVAGKLETVFEKGNGVTKPAESNTETQNTVLQARNESADVSNLEDRGTIAEGTGAVKNASLPASNEQWLTPKRKGSKHVTRLQREAMTSNEYKALEDAEGVLVTDLRLLSNG
uniref:DUF4283 domain-containing protein n=1 Tax=Cannabis sativa TaxID=3483 RepID=A0A803NJ88_CANSA